MLDRVSFNILDTSKQKLSSNQTWKLHDNSIVLHFDLPLL